MTFENVQAGLRTDYLFRLANQHDAHRARHRRPVGAGARLVHLRRRRPDVALQRQCRRAEDADPAPDPLGDRVEQFDRRRAATLDAILATEISPELVPVGAGQRRRARRPRSGPTSCRTSTCSTRCATASARPRSPSWRCTPGSDASAAPGRRASPTTAARLRAARDPALADGVPAAASSRSASSSAPPCRTGPRCRPAARCRRAATGARPRTAAPRPGWTMLANVPAEEQAG